MKTYPQKPPERSTKKTSWLEPDINNTDANKLDLRNEIQTEHRTHPVPWAEWVFQTFQVTTQPAKKGMMKI
jgi:hypothetical protein